MRIQALAVFALATLVGSGCYDDGPYRDLIALNAARGTTSTGPDPSVASVSVTGFESLSGGDSTDGGLTGGGLTDGGSTGGGSTGGGVGEAGGELGLDVALTVTPEILYQAGFVTLSVEHESAAVSLELWDEIDPEKPQLTWTPGEPVPSYLITRGDFRNLTVRAYDEHGNVGISDVATVALQFPSRGATLWEKTIELGTEAQGRAVAADFLLGDLSIVTGFDSDSSATLGRHSAIGEPALFTSLGSPVSTTSGVAIMPDGWVLATGGEMIGVDARMWLARVNPHTGESETLHQGELGETATGLAVDHELGRVYVSGYVSLLGEPDAADAKIWALTLKGDVLWSRTWERPVEDIDDLKRPNDQGLAVAVLDNHDPVLVGETRLLPTKIGATLEHWAFVHRFDSSGGFNPNMKSWTSPLIFNAAGAYAVAPDVENGLLVAGWTSFDAEANRQATILTFDELLIEAEAHHYGPAGFWNAKGVARLQTGDIVYLADADVDDEERHDFEVRGIDAFTFDLASWTKLVSGEKGTRAAGLTVTPEGHIVIIGTSLDEGGTSMILQGLHP